MSNNDPREGRPRVDNVAVACHKAQKRQEIEEWRRRLLLASLICMVVTFTATLCLDLPEPIPMHTSILTGQLWLNELIQGHDGRFKDQLGVAKHVFFWLSFELQVLSGLRSTKHVTADEKLATFLHFARTGCSTRGLQERFQCSADTIQNSVYSTLHCLLGSFYTKHIHLPSNDTPPEIKNQPKFYPYFCNCRGAIDGSHFHAWVLSDSIARYRNHKGFIGQNVLAACNFALLFVYLLSRWEGSASDSQIFNYVWERDFAVPLGRYYLADVGFPLCDVLSTPYRGVRYHLKEWGSSKQRKADFPLKCYCSQDYFRPCNAKELFNLQHAQLRNIIEHIFGIIKRRWLIFTRAQEYPIETQAKFVCAVRALHNFIRVHNVDDDAQDLVPDAPQPAAPLRCKDSIRGFVGEEPHKISPAELGMDTSAEERECAGAHWDRIAEQMWKDYVKYLAACGEHPEVD